jgi:3-methyl-2-oxobutanoate hydroxymethyltransferase
MLGLNVGDSPRFAKHYAELRTAIVTAASGFAQEVRDGAYPDPAHSYNWQLKSQL